MISFRIYEETGILVIRWRHKYDHTIIFFGWIMIFLGSGNAA